MKVSELTEKSLFIHNKNEKLMAQWATYKSSLIKATTSSRLKIFHEFSCGDGDSVNFTVFDHFMVEIRLAGEFYSKTIQYGLRLDTGDEARFVELGRASFDDEGMLDGRVNNRDRDGVLEHYLERIQSLYDTLYHAMQDTRPLNEVLLARWGATASV
ncbi:formate hydrogenlyase regulator HycA [Edwardsiella tarda]|uniref:formate hydrogenlyase regulator HycA n=1 Tax=Edwardsiella tarda TaxID=636 RepID=UPI00351C68D7